MTTLKLTSEIEIDFTISDECNAPTLGNLYFNGKQVQPSEWFEGILDDYILKL
jgi:hypothetical protein